MRKAIAYILIISLLAASCSVRRYIPKGDTIYKGSIIHVTKHPDTKDKTKALKKTLKLAVKPTRNKFLFGHPYKVWWWYVIGEPKRETGLKAFLRKKLAEPPVLGSRVNATSSAENMESLMTNLGYFKTTVQGDTFYTGSYFIKANYYAQVQPQYVLDTIEWVQDSSRLMKLLLRDFSRRGLLKKGDPYTLSTITAERERLDIFLKTRGYYFFNPDYLMAYADSTVGNRKVNLLLNIKKSTPEEALQPYTINSITVFPDYSLNAKHLDTSKADAVLFDGLLINDPHKKYKPVLFKQTITYRPGRLYSSRTQNATLNRLINLGPFKFVKNRFEPISDSSSAAIKDSGNFAIMIDTARSTPKKDTAVVLHRLDAYYYLTPAKKKSLQAEIDAFTKENNYVGSQVSVNWKNRNAFRGGEQLAVKVYGGFQTTSGGDSIRNNNFRLGTEVSLKMPRYAIPFFNLKENFFYPPNTNLLLGYEWFKQDLYYTKNLFRFQYDFTWKPDLQTEITVAPVSLSYLQATNITDSFYKQAAQQPSLLTSVYSESTLGSFFSYTHNSGFRSRKNKWYYMASLDLSGNIAGLITGSKGYREKDIFGVPFAQYVKIDFDVHYTRKLPNNYDWANRIQIGLGNPYNNSKLLPYAKLYTIGGSSSIRGFRSRTLGPGSYKTTAADQKYFQLIGGDYKLLLNSELRIPFTKQLGAAVFIDAGNIWTKDTILFGEAGKLSKNFLKEIAVAAGIGIRFDATILLIRADLGIPLRKPFLPENQRWVYNQFNFGSGAWRRENLILNIAIGYPF